MRFRTWPLVAATGLGIATVVVLNHVVISDASGQAAAPAADIERSDEGDLHRSAVG